MHGQQGLRAAVREPEVLAACWFQLPAAGGMVCPRAGRQDEGIAGVAGHIVPALILPLMTQ